MRKTSIYGTIFVTLWGNPLISNKTSVYRGNNPTFVRFLQVKSVYYIGKTDPYFLPQNHIKIYTEKFVLFRQMKNP